MVWSRQRRGHQVSALSAQEAPACADLQRQLERHLAASGLSVPRVVRRDANDTFPELLGDGEWQVWHWHDMALLDPHAHLSVTGRRGVLVSGEAEGCVWCCWRACDPFVLYLMGCTYIHRIRALFQVSEVRPEM